MTAVFLQNELQTLIQESKRKFPETRGAAEKSLSDLKSLSITSESQLSGDLIRKPQFVEPFVFACKSRNVKLVPAAVNCLQRLASGRAIPRERLSDVLDALREIASQSLDVQLKILQTLPALLQLYTSDIRGPLLAAALEICDVLQASKTAVVSSTAEATFQQLVTTVYDRVTSEDKQAAESDSQIVKIGNKSVSLRPAAHDAFRVFADICTLANGAQPEFVQLRTLSPHFLLEVVGSIATNYSSVIADHPEQLEVCRSSLLPALNKILTTKNTFPLLVRTLRIFYILLRDHLGEMVVELEDVLFSMIHLLEPNSGQPWKRILSMEVFRAICSESSLLRDLYRIYDDTEGRKKIVGNFLASFVRIASEDPSLIGLGRQSTMPSTHRDVVNGDGITSFEASDIGGAVGGVVSASITVTGLSTEWSIAKVPYLEQLDRSNVSDLPSTYIYSLILNCISALAEGLSRFVMPLSVPGKVQSQRARIVKDDSEDTANVNERPSSRSTTTRSHLPNKLINPLTLEDHPQREALSSCARMLDTSWPPLLATCSTFFNAALDAEYYHNLVRAFQKLTQVSGILELATARDALLTTLGKSALPPSSNTRLFSPVSQQNVVSHQASASDPIVQTPQSATSKDFGLPRLSVRNLLCLRALLNLGIALGPSLGTDASFIILETLQRAESLVARMRNSKASIDTPSDENPAESGGIRTLLGVETAAVQTASKRMFESTSQYTDESFTMFVASLFRLDRTQDESENVETLPSPTSPVESPTRARLHHANRSISGLLITADTATEDQDFVISKTAELARANMQRFLSPKSVDCSWKLLLKRLIDIFTSQQANVSNRLKCAEEMDFIVLEIVKTLEQHDENLATNVTILRQCLGVLLAQLPVIEDEATLSEEYNDLRQKSHTKLLSALENVIGHCGEMMTREWTHVLKLISSAFTLAEKPTEDTIDDDLSEIRNVPRSEDVLQKAFRCLQLVVSDFLSAMDVANLTKLTYLLFSFGSQKMALNISLTTTTFFWNVSLLLKDAILRTPNNGDGQHSSTETSQNILAGTQRTWMLLFSRVSLLGLDERTDVRQSSIRMTMKLLEATREELSSTAWNSCVLRLLAVCSSQLDMAAKSKEEMEILWQEAAVQTLTGTTEVAIENITKICNSDSFEETWSKFVQTCGAMLEQNTLPGSTATFKSIASILESLATLDMNQNARLPRSVITICFEHHPANISLERESNQAALTAYVAALAAVFSMAHDLKLDSASVTQAVERVVLECVHPPYTSDTKALAPEQEAVVRFLPQLQTLLTGGAFSNVLQVFIKAPLASSESRTNATFIALSSRCASLLNSTIVATLRDNAEAVDVVAVLETLTELISTKYTSLPQGGPTPLWQTATTTAVEITQAVMQSKFQVENLPQMVTTFTTVATAILQSGGLPTAHGLDVIDEEAFDISSFTALHTTIKHTIGRESVPASHLKSYIIVLFNASLVAEPFFFDFPDDLNNHPLENISTVRPGTVCHPVYARRNQICYTALDTLFSLVSRDSAHSTTQEHLRLARTAAPYLLLRCAYTFKTFIADQPLRSIDELPQPLRVELLAILNKCVDLRCETNAFIDLANKMGGDYTNDGKAHLRLLNKFVVRLGECWQKLPRKMSGVNWQDRKDGKEIESAMDRWRDCLAEGWEVS